MENEYEFVPMRISSLDEKWFTGVSPNARKHLLGSMKTLETGVEPAPSFPLYGERDAKVICEQFLNLISESHLKVPQWQLEYEKSRIAKVGRQGGVPSWKDCKENFLLYFSRPKEVDKEKFEKYFDKSIYLKYENLNVRLASYKDTLDILIEDDKIQDKASGWRMFDLKKSDTLAQIEALNDVHSGNWINGWAYIFTSLKKLKIRIFWPMPFSDMILEAQFFYPILKAIQTDLRANGERSPFISFADKIGFKNLFKIYDSLIQKESNPEHIVMVQRDFDKMDTTQSFYQTQVSMYPKILKSYGFSETSEEAKRIKDILYFGSKIPVATPEGMYTGSHGKPSGANTTNWDECESNEDYGIVYLNILAEKCAKAGIKYKVVVSFENGDDGHDCFILYDWNRLEEFEKLIDESADEACQIFGYLKNDKWLIKPYGIYCQYMIEYREGHIWYAYPAILALNAGMNPKKQLNKDVWDGDFVDWRWIQILTPCQNLQYFDLLVDFVDNGMKYGLMGRNQEDFDRILSKYERYRELHYDEFNAFDEDDKIDFKTNPVIQHIIRTHSYRMI